MFFAAPHFPNGTPKADAKRTVDLLSRCQLHRGFGGTLPNYEDVDALIKLCMSFERLVLSVPVVSVFETKKTSTSRNIFLKLRSKGRNQIVCDSFQPPSAAINPCTPLVWLADLYISDYLQGSGGFGT